MLHLRYLHLFFNCFIFACFSYVCLLLFVALVANYVNVSITLRTSYHFPTSLSAVQLMLLLTIYDNALFVLFGGYSALYKSKVPSPVLAPFLLLLLCSLLKNFKSVKFDQGQELLTTPATSSEVNTPLPSNSRPSLLQRRIKPSSALLATLN